MWVCNNRLLRKFSSRSVFVSGNSVPDNRSGGCEKVQRQSECSADFRKRKEEVSWPEASKSIGDRK